MAQDTKKLTVIAGVGKVAIVGSEGDQIIMGADLADEIADELHRKAEASRTMALVETRGHFEDLWLKYADLQPARGGVL